jgi:hypothetical protein
MVAAHVTESVYALFRRCGRRFDCPRVGFLGGLSVEKQQTLLFEFKDYELRNQKPGNPDRDPQSAADNGSTLASIAAAVANRGGSAASTRSRSRNSSSIRIGVSQGAMHVQSKPSGYTESQSITSSLHTLLASFAGADAATAFLKDSRDMMAQWLGSKAERSITFKHSGDSVVLRERDDIDKLIAHLQQL